MTAELEIRGLSKSFNGVAALSDLSFVLHPGEVLGLIGPNGAGKTTLFNVISRFILADSGEVIFRRQTITGFSPSRVANLGISRTFQNLRLISQMSVIENVSLAFRNQPGEELRTIFLSWPKIQRSDSEKRKEAMFLLDGVGLAHEAGRAVGELSYGKQKLLSILCCFAADPVLLLLDEPVAGLAPAVMQNVLEIIQGLPAKGKSIILIEHNIDAIMQVCHRVIFMDAGKKISEGSPEEVRNDPRVIAAYIQ